MGKPILERMKRPSWWRDQGLHMLLGAVVFCIVADPLAYAADWNLLGSVTCGLFAGMGVIFGRELIQNWGDEPELGSVEDTSLDALFGMTGAVLGILSLWWA